MTVVLKNLITCHVLMLLLASNVNTTYGQSGVCKRTRGEVVYSLTYSSVLYYYSQSYSFCCGIYIFFCWNNCHRTHARTAYRSHSYLSHRWNYYTETYCCPDYSGSPLSGCQPKPIPCHPSCVNGHCTLQGICECNYGWSGSLCEKDIDECSKGLVSVGVSIQNANSSGGGDPQIKDFWCEQKCENTIGSFECACQTGYYLENDKQTCSDIDECAEGLVSVGEPIQTSNSSERGASETILWCGHICNNTVGSFECVCETGYYLDDDNQTCLDINECATSNGGCNQTCHNTNGSYYCTCMEGYYLEDDLIICTDIDECQYGNAGCAHNCVNQWGSYQCQCKDKYLLANNSHDCYALCEPNTFSWNGLEPCTPCPVHHYQPEFGGIKCLECNDSVSLEACMSVLSTMQAESPSLHKSISAPSSAILPVTISCVLIVVLIVIVAVVLIVSFSLLDKRSKASQCHIVQQGHNSLTLNPYAKTKTREAEATYDNFKKDCQLGEEPSVNTTNGQHVYDDMVFVGTSEYTVHLGNVPELPPRNSNMLKKLKRTLSLWTLLILLVNLGIMRRSMIMKC